MFGKQTETQQMAMEWGTHVLAAGGGNPILRYCQTVVIPMEGVFNPQCSQKGHLGEGDSSRGLALFSLHLCVSASSPIWGSAFPLLQPAHKFLIPQLFGVSPSVCWTFICGCRNLNSLFGWLHASIMYSGVIISPEEAGSIGETCRNYHPIVINHQSCLSTSKMTWSSHFKCVLVHIMCIHTFC